MIVVAGFNTAIDVLVEVDRLQPGAVHRHRDAMRLPGGKGVHVAQTAAALGTEVKLVGLTDDVHGEAIAAHLHARGVDFHGIGTSRVRDCLALREPDGRVTELLDDGAHVDGATAARLRDTFLELAADADLAVLSGSLPRGCPPTLYAELVDSLQSRGVRCLVDASGAALRMALDARPFLVKPNRDEAASLLQRPIPSLDAAAEAIALLQSRGVRMPLLSLGVEGALLADGDAVLHGHLPLDRSVNPVGSGDCMLAAVAVSLARGDDAIDALRLGVACGAANAAGRETGHADPAQVQALLPRVAISRLPQPFAHDPCTHGTTP